MERKFHQWKPYSEIVSGNDGGGGRKDVEPINPLLQEAFSYATRVHDTYPWSTATRKRGQLPLLPHEASASNEVLFMRENRIIPRVNSTHTLILREADAAYGTAWTHLKLFIDNNPNLTDETTAERVKYVPASVGIRRPNPRDLYAHAERLAFDMAARPGLFLPREGDPNNALITVNNDLLEMVPVVALPEWELLDELSQLQTRMDGRWPEGVTLPPPPKEFFGQQTRQSADVFKQLVDTMANDEITRTTTIIEGNVLTAVTSGHDGTGQPMYVLLDKKRFVKADKGLALFDRREWEFRRVGSHDVHFLTDLGEEAGQDIPRVIFAEDLEFDEIVRGIQASADAENQTSEQTLSKGLKELKRLATLV